jgi:hypothetical protein
VEWAGHVERVGEEFLKVFGGDVKEKSYMEDLGVDMVITLNWMLKGIGWEGAKGINLVQNRGHWRDLMNRVVNFQVS